ncbi:3D domain-containing protein [Caulobacter sp. 73W]|uniref:3D domain-containing protein n=1 Tax=Caulobacter sp. 73W TaxID=3161137 RepID=A0AB39KRB6_9CAUL
MRRLVGLVAAITVAAGFSSAAHAQNAQTTGSDPMGELIIGALSAITPGIADMKLKATLYHAGARGVGALDSLGCKVVAMRTAAIDSKLIPRRTVLFIKETVGLPMPDGGMHDGYWYASDVGGAIKGERIDLFTGSGRGSMSPMMPLNMSRLSVSKVGQFKGCPPK